MKHLDVFGILGGLENSWTVKDKQIHFSRILFETFWDNVSYLIVWLPTSKEFKRLEPLLNIRYHGDDFQWTHQKCMFKHSTWVELRCCKSREWEVSSLYMKFFKLKFKLFFIRICFHNKGIQTYRIIYDF